MPANIIPDPPFYRNNVITYPQRFDPGQFYSYVYSHPLSQEVLWYKAYPNTTYSKQTGLMADATTNPSKWDRQLQITTNRRAIISASRLSRDFTSFGKLELADVVIVSMPDELPLSENDWVVPMGRGELDQAGLRAPSFVAKEYITRGNTKYVGNGTIAASGTTITGTGTNFLTDANIGDIIEAGGEQILITSISNSTRLTVETAPSPTWNGQKYSFCYDNLLFYPAAKLLDVYQDVAGNDYSGQQYWATAFWDYSTGITANTLYDPKADLKIAADGRRIVWKSASMCPKVGEVYGVIYRHYLKYVVLPEVTVQRPSTAGFPLPQTTYARQWGPETFK
jgi:hypothetical protein